MKLVTRLAGFLSLTCTLSAAAGWSGILVDSKCYDSEERNVNPTDTLTYVDRDGNLELRYCSPTARTKSFAVIQADGTTLYLDSAGNAQAAKLVPRKKSLLSVAVAGEIKKKTIQVDSIALAR